MSTQAERNRAATVRKRTPSAAQSAPSRSRLGWVVLVLAILLAVSVLPAQDKQSKFEYWPGASYDPAVPTLQKAAGHDPGDRITRPEDILKYVEALAAARPQQMRVFDYAKTWEGRRLVYCAISSEAPSSRSCRLGGPTRGAT